MSRYTPPSWKVCAYRGARIVDVAAILEKATLPNHVKALIVFVGLNDRLRPTEVNHGLVRLKAVMNREQHRFRKMAAMEIPHLATNTHLYDRGTDIINEIMQDLFDNDRMLIPIPPDLRFAPRSPYDVSHVDDDGAKRLLNLAEYTLNTLN